MTKLRGWVPWLALVLVLGGALLVGNRSDGRPPTEDERVERIADSVRCPTCENISAAESSAPSSSAVRDAIRERVRAGESDDEVRDYLVSRYDEGILLEPETRGAGLVVWALPAVLLVVVAAGLTVVFRRRGRRPTSVTTVSADDRALVDEAMQA